MTIFTFDRKLKLNKELQIWKNIVKDYEETTNTLREENKKLRRDIKDLEEELAKKNMQIEKLHKRLAESPENEDLHEKIVRLNRDYNDMKRSRDIYHRLFAGAKEQNKKLYAQMVKLQPIVINFGEETTEDVDLHAIARSCGDLNAVLSDAVKASEGLDQLKDDLKTSFAISNHMYETLVHFDPER